MMLKFVGVIQDEELFTEAHYYNMANSYSAHMPVNATGEAVKN